MDFITEWGHIAGIAGLGLGTFFILFKNVLRKIKLPILTKKQSFTLILTFVMLTFTMSALSIILYFLKDGKAQAQLTIFVTDTKGNVVLDHKGKVNTSIGNSSLRSTIGEDGRVNFDDIPSVYIGDTITIGLKAEGWIIADNNTFIFNGEHIKLKVKKDSSLGIIKGVVKTRDGQEFIPGVKIMINSDTIIYSNSNGVFNVLLPEEMRIKTSKEGYKLTIFKEGYRTQTQYYYTKSTDADLRLERN